MNELRKVSLFWLAGILMLMTGCRERPRVYAEVEEAHGLEVGARVIFRGVLIGDVENIAFKGSVVRLTMALNRLDVPLRAADRIRVRPDGLLGNPATIIIPGSAAAPPLAMGGTLSAAAPDTLAEARRAAADALLSRLARHIDSALGRDSTVFRSKLPDST